MKSRRLLPLLLLFLLLLGASKARAQQTIFNVPSQEVLPAGRIYFEVDVPFRTEEPRYLGVTPRVVVGAGDGIEVGLNLPGFQTPGSTAWTAILAGKHGQALDAEGKWHLTEGVNVSLPLTMGRDAGLLGYLSTGYTFGDVIRLSAGVYGASKAVAGTANAVGGLGSIEYFATSWLTLAGDAYSGKNQLGYTTFGLVISAGKWSLYPAYELSNTDALQNSYLFELGYSL